MVNFAKSVLRDMGVGQAKHMSRHGDAITHLRNSPVDVLILDDSLTDQNVFEYVAKLRIDTTIVSRFVPLILFSDNGRPKTILSAIKAGVDEVLVKPITERAFRARVINTFETPRKCIVVPSGYVGPDRRRSVSEFMTGEDRRSQDKANEIPRKSAAG